MKSLLPVVALLVLGSSAIAEARKPEDVFGGKILISDQPFPQQARSAEAYIGALKKNSRDRIAENKEDKEWRVFFVAFFKQPVNDLEVSVRVYDVTSGRRLVDTFEQYLANASQRAYASNVRLKRGDGTSGYDPNSKILIVMENKGRVLAQTTFFITGEGRKYNGTVDFSEEETK